MSETNKIPSNNSIIDLKTFYNKMLDDMRKYGYKNLITNGDFSLVVETESETPPIELT